MDLVADFEDVAGDGLAVDVDGGAVEVFEDVVGAALLDDGVFGGAEEAAEADIALWCAAEGGFALVEIEGSAAEFSLDDAEFEDGVGAGFGDGADFEAASAIGQRLVVGGAVLLGRGGGPAAEDEVEFADGDDVVVGDGFGGVAHAVDEETVGGVVVFDGVAGRGAEDHGVEAGDGVTFEGDVVLFAAADGDDFFFEREFFDEAVVFVNDDIGHRLFSDCR